MSCYVWWCALRDVRILRLQVAVSRASDAWRRVRYSRHPPTTHRLGMPPATTAVQVPLVLAKVVSGFGSLPYLATNLAWHALLLSGASPSSLALRS